MRQDDVSLAELRDAAKVIAEALSRLGRYFDPSRDEDLDRTVQYVSDLMASDPEKYEELVIALIRPQAPPSKRAGWLCMRRSAQPRPARAEPFGPVVIHAARTPADEFLMDDVPSRGTSYQRLILSRVQKASKVSESMTWSRLLGILTLALLVSAASMAGIVLTFALLMRYLGWQTVWNEIFPWATDRLDMITTYLAGGTVLASVLMKRLARERA
jgi:hypothetical protein